MLGIDGLCLGRNLLADEDGSSEAHERTARRLQDADELSSDMRDAEEGKGEEATREQQRVVEHSLGAQLVHDKIHDAHHQVAERALVRDGQLERLDSQCVALQDRSQALQTRSTLVSRLLVTQLE